MGGKRCCKYLGSWFCVQIITEFEKLFLFLVSELYDYQAITCLERARPRCITASPGHYLSESIPDESRFETQALSLFLMYNNNNIHHYQFHTPQDSCWIFVFQRKHQPLACAISASSIYHFPFTTLRTTPCSILELAFIPGNMYQ